LLLFPSQLPKLVMQASPQREALHVGEALAPLGHTVPHAPQFVTLDVVSMQTPLQRIVGGIQLIAHMPIEQLCPEGHALPQAPQ
jgi:hypothetical protein